MCVCASSSVCVLANGLTKARRRKRDDIEGGGWKGTRQSRCAAMRTDESRPGRLRALC